jgi:hypothetical protein
MTWVHRLIEDTCSRLGIIVKGSNNSIQIGSCIIKVVDDDPTYTIRISDISHLNRPVEITNIFYDDLEQSLETTLRSIH